MNGFFLFQRFMPPSNHCLVIYIPCCWCSIKPSQCIKRKKNQLSLRLTWEACDVLVVGTYILEHITRRCHTECWLKKFHTLISLTFSWPSPQFTILHHVVTWDLLQITRDIWDFGKVYSFLELDIPESVISWQSLKVSHATTINHQKEQKNLGWKNNILGGWNMSNVSVHPITHFGLSNNLQYCRLGWQNHIHVPHHKWELSFNEQVRVTCIWTQANWIFWRFVLQKVMLSFFPVILPNYKSASTAYPQKTL